MGGACCKAQAPPGYKAGKGRVGRAPGYVIENLRALSYEP